jgi:hypothetical protein
MRAVRVRWKLAAGGAAVLAAAAAFLAWGPVGLGNGPLHVGGLEGGEDMSVAPHQAWWGLLIRVDAPDVTVIIDQVSFRGGAGYPGPRVRALWTDRDEACGGAWPWHGRGGLLRTCAVGGLARLTSRPIPDGATLTVPELGRVRYPGEAIVAQVAPPARDCWVVTSVVIRYHVGIRHYTATTRVSFDACLTQAEEDSADTALRES